MMMIVPLSNILTHVVSKKEQDLKADDILRTNLKKIRNAKCGIVCAKLTCYKKTGAQYLHKKKNQSLRRCLKKCCISPKDILLPFKMTNFKS